ncbi:MFS transporter [Ideonella sp. A 288]|uniref:MFS transporter n=1 Tax=Ideonella sp. A 288 TaxID=1962181 RepID=UPI000B4BB1DD|nr:MFS transporter [Ideonella sp. A 288]
MRLVGWRAAAVFLVFAWAYFFSALLRAVTATLAPEFSRELGLGAGQLGLLAGAYFLGFSAMQLPLGEALDRMGPKRVLITLLTVAVAGCAAFSMATTMTQLLMARLVIGLGVAGCLMAPLTLFRVRFDPVLQLRTNSWMLMTGSLGMLASTLPTRWLLPMVGWRGLFVAVAVLLMLSALLIAWVVPPDPRRMSPGRFQGSGYRAVFSAPAFIRLAPAGFFSYGGMIALQSLWIGPWLTQVGHRTAAEAAEGLFVVNASMLVAFLAWGLAMPHLLRAGWSAERLMTVAWPAGVLCLAFILWRGPDAGALEWAVWCVSTSVVSLSQPAVAQAFPKELAGRALSAFNLVIFFGVFAVQWGLGLVIDALLLAGWSTLEAYRASFATMLLAIVGAFAFMHMRAWAP